MSTPLAITTGNQSISATGAVTGTLSTNGLAKTGWLKLRVMNLTPGQSMRVAIEDTANVTPFSDASTVCVFDIAGGEQVGTIPENEAEYGIELFRIPSVRFGSTLNSLRANVTALSGGATPLLQAWLEQ